MPENEKKLLISLENMETYTAELKAKYARKADVTALGTRVTALENAGAQANVIEGVEINGTLLTLAEKVADILIAEGATNGTIKVNNVDVAVHGLAALAYKSEVAESDLADALKAIIDAKAKQADLDTLTGTGDGSISKMIDAAFNDFSTKVTDDGVVNSYKELIDYVAAHGSEAATMAAGIAENKTVVADLKKLVGELPEGAAATTVVGYIAEAIAALSIGDYAKTSEVEGKIAEAMGNVYSKKDIDDKLAGYVKTSDIQTATAEEIRALLVDEAQ